MAEFAEVIKQAKRMCAAHGGMCISRNCPLDNGEACRLATDQDGEDCSDVEQIIMEWAAKHPTRYPTWNEWQKSTFPSASDVVSPCSFAGVDELRCNELLCEACREQPIPADIAAKLGIRPIEEG